jgi:hypothetical protein
MKGGVPTSGDTLMSDRIIGEVTSTTGYPGLIATLRARVSPARCLVFVFVFWLFCAYPAVASAELGAKTERCFTLQFIFVPIRNCAHQIKFNSLARRCGNMTCGLIRYSFDAKCLSAFDGVELFDERSLNIHRKVAAAEELTPHLDFLGNRLTDVETKQRGSGFVFRFVRKIVRDVFELGDVNSDFWTMGRNELLASKYGGVTSYAKKSASSYPQGDGRDDQQGSEQSYVSVRLIENLVPPSQEFGSSIDDSLQNRHEAPIKNALIFFSGLMGGALLFFLMGRLL